MKSCIPTQEMNRVLRARTLETIRVTEEITSVKEMDVICLSYTRIVARRVIRRRHAGEVLEQLVHTQAMETTKEEAKIEEEGEIMEEGLETVPEIGTKLRPPCGVLMEMGKGILCCLQSSRGYMRSGGLTVAARITFRESNSTLQTIEDMALVKQLSMLPTEEILHVRELIWMRSLYAYYREEAERCPHIQVCQNQLSLSE